MADMAPASFIPTVSKSPVFDRTVKPLLAELTDLNINWIPNYTPSVLKHKASIDEKITNVLTTLRGSEQFEPEFGSRLPLLLFEPMTADTERRVWMETVSSLRRNMRGVILVSHGESFVRANYTSKSYVVGIVYTHLKLRERMATGITLRAG